MSAKNVKRARQAARAGISKAAHRAELEFEALVSRTRAEFAADTEIVSLGPKRHTLAWAGLLLFALAVLVPVALAGC